MKIFDVSEISKMSVALHEKFGEFEILVDELRLTEHGALVIFSLDKDGASMQKVAFFNLVAELKWCEDV